MFNVQYCIHYRWDVQKTDILHQTSASDYTCLFFYSLLTHTFFTKKMISMVSVFLFYNLKRCIVNGKNKTF